MNKVLFIYALILLILTVYITMSNFRIRSFFYRYRSLKKRKFPSTQFKIRKIYNPHYSEGVISTTLFGDITNEKFIGPLLSNKLYIPPKWHLRIYLSPKVEKKFIEKLIEKDYEIYLMDEESEGFTGTCWRFLPLSEGKPFLSIDLDDLDKKNKDGILGQWGVSKELFEKWNQSRKPFIIFGSSLCSPIMAGKWGAKYFYPQVIEKLESLDLRKFGSDEMFLKEFILPIAKKNKYLKLSVGIENFIDSLKG